MSFFKKLFGGEKSPAPVSSVPSSAPAPPVPPVDLSRAGEPIDCSGIDWNGEGQLRWVREVLAERVGDRLAPLLLSERFRGNAECSPTDAAVLFSMAASMEPGRIMEIGSGYTTATLRHAKEVYMLPGELIAVDPAPRIDIFDLVDAHLEQPAQEVPVSDFQILVEGEILFLDTTHIYRPGGEVEYLIDKVLPALNPGVVVGMHGIRLPRNYTRAELEKGFSEQARLLAHLRARPAEIIFSGGWLAEHHPGVVDSALPGIPGESTALWFRVK